MNGKFIKIIRIVFFSLLALSLITCTGIFIFFQTFDTDRYLLQITKKASLALGRPVFIGSVGLGFSSQGITLDAAPVTIADDLGFTTQPFIEVDRVRISLDLRSLFFHREIHITDILLQSPQVHFIRSEEGNINVRSIGQVSRPAGDGTVVKRPNIIDIAGVLARSAFQRNEVTKQSFNSKEIAFSLKNVSPNGTIKDIKSIRIQDASISFIDQNKTIPLDIWLTNINTSLNDFSLSKPFQLIFDASLYSNAPNVHGKAILFLDLLKGSVQATDLGLTVDLSRLDIKRLKGISPDISDSSVLNNINGTVQLNLAHLGIGASGNLEANGDMTITDGVIKNFNVIKTVLSHTLEAFGMEGNMDNVLNGKLKDKLGAEDTIIEKADAQFSLHDKAIFIDNSLIKTNIFELTAKGSVDQGLNTNMQTMLQLNADVSTALVNELGGLKYLMDDSKRIAIGASLKGTIPHLKYKPDKDFRKKSKKVLIEEGGNILGILLGSGQISIQGQETSSQDTGKKLKKNFKNILKSFLQ